MMLTLEEANSLVLIFFTCHQLRKQYLGCTDDV